MIPNYDIISTNNLTNVPAMLITSGNVVNPVRRIGMSILTQKKCTKCGEIKPISEFHIKYKLLGIYRSRCKNCVNEDNLKYKHAHLEEEREKSRLRAAADRAKNPEKRNETTRQWRLRYPERVKELDSKYAKAHPDKRREYTRIRNARKKEVGGTITAEQEEALFKKYNHTCLCCGRRVPEIKLTLDHIVPITKGGSNTIDNAQPLCKSCNSSKGNRYIEDYRKQWD